MTTKGNQGDLVPRVSPTAEVAAESGRVVM
jgi:hypothetical protein